MGGEEGNLLCHFFTSPGCREEGKMDREQIKKERGNKRKEEHH